MFTIYTVAILGSPTNVHYMFAPFLNSSPESNISKVSIRVLHHRVPSIGIMKYDTNPKRHALFISGNPSNLPYICCLFDPPPNRSHLMIPDPKRCGPQTCACNFFIASGPQGSLVRKNPHAPRPTTGQWEFVGDIDGVQRRKTTNEKKSSAPTNQP